MYTEKNQTYCRVENGVNVTVKQPSCIHDGDRGPCALPKTHARANSPPLYARARAPLHHWNPSKNV